MKKRKSDHIELAPKSQVKVQGLGQLFNYEPLLSPLPSRDEYFRRSFSFLGKKMQAPLWVSSMTGGNIRARTINRNLAKICGEFGLGMGLGSCRPLLESPDCFEDFNVRPLIGEEYPLMGNLGVAQIEQLLEQKAHHKLGDLLATLSLDGLFVHINPLQEWAQKEGDRIVRPPLETIQELLEKVAFPVAIKEVGQGFGPKSLAAAIQLPLAAIEFGALGGTNFTLLETMRNNNATYQSSSRIMASVGHCAEEMVLEINALLERLGPRALCREFIISGGVSSFLHGFSLIQSLKGKGVYGQAHAFLAHADNKDEKALRTYVKDQLVGLELANRYLTLK